VLVAAGNCSVHADSNYAVLAFIVITE